jgi:hypothetical protein
LNVWDYNLQQQNQVYQHKVGDHPLKSIAVSPANPRLLCVGDTEGSVTLLQVTFPAPGCVVCWLGWLSASLKLPFLLLRLIDFFLKNLRPPFARLFVNKGDEESVGAGAGGEAEHGVHV